LINTELENDIDLKIIVKIQGKVSEAVFHELIDTGMLDKKNTSKAAYHFSYKHIQDVVKDDKKEYHKWAINYYSNKIRDCGKTCADQIELLFHQSMSNPKEKHVDAFLDLCGRVGPGQFGFARLIEAGEKLRPCFNKDERIYASLIGSIAVLYHKLTRFESAEEHYKEALKIYRALAGRNPDAFNSDLAMTLNNLAGLYKDLRNFESAEEHYKEALKIYRALARRNPDAFNSDLAETLNGYGNLYRELKKFEEANKFYSEAFELYQCMAKKSPYAFEHFLVRIKADISRLYIDSGKESEGITCLNDCLKRNDLLPDLGAESFAALGAAQERLQNAKEAAENYLSAASTYFILFKKGVRCLDEIMKDLQKVKELGDGETKGDTEMMLTAMKRLKGEETAIPEVELSKRGMALKDALERKAAYSEFQPESVIDDMILILIKDLSESNLRS
jgi:tetratricopeptide (TPR) repeat protein